MIEFGSGNAEVGKRAEDGGQIVEFGSANAEMGKRTENRRRRTENRG